MIFVVNLSVPVYRDVRSPYGSRTPVNQITYAYQNAPHTGVGEAEPANLWDDLWVCPVLEAGFTSSNWLDITEADVPVDALCRKHNTTAIQEPGARRAYLFAQRPSRPAIQRVPVDSEVSDGDCGVGSFHQVCLG